MTKVARTAAYGVVLAAFVAACAPMGRGAGVDGVAAVRGRLRRAFPGLFLPDMKVMEAQGLDRPRVFGDPDPPEGFAGPDPSGRLGTGVYVPPAYVWPDTADISLAQWIVHEAFHLRNRRTGEFDSMISEAFPDDSDPLVRWIARDPYHASFAREEAFINLVTFADPARTDAQRGALRRWVRRVGAGGLDEEALRRVMAVVEHPAR